MSKNLPIYHIVWCPTMYKKKKKASYLPHHIKKNKYKKKPTTLVITAKKEQKKKQISKFLMQKKINQMKEQKQISLSLFYPQIFYFTYTLNMGWDTISVNIFYCYKSDNYKMYYFTIVSKIAIECIMLSL